MFNDISSRIARFAHEERHGIGTWDKLSDDEKIAAREWAWRKVFKEEGEFRDPYFTVRDGTDANSLLTYPKDRIYSLDEAKGIARGKVNDEVTIARVIEIIEREVTVFYQRVVKTVVEGNGDA